MALEKISLDRWKAQVEADTRKAELEVKKLELEAQYAEHLAAAKIKEKEADEALRAKRREDGRNAQNKKREMARNAQAAPAACRVCENDHDINLTAADIQFHHAGHPANFTPGMFS